jgi:hypothetical protein
MLPESLACLGWQPCQGDKSPRNRCHQGNDQFCKRTQSGLPPFAQRYQGKRCMHRPGRQSLEWPSLWGGTGRRKPSTPYRAGEAVVGYFPGPLRNGPLDKDRKLPAVLWWPTCWPGKSGCMWFLGQLYPNRKSRRKRTRPSPGRSGGNCLGTRRTARLTSWSSPDKTSRRNRRLWWLSCRSGVGRGMCMICRRRWIGSDSSDTACTCRSLGDL